MVTRLPSLSRNFLMVKLALAFLIDCQFNLITMTTEPYLSEQHDGFPPESW